MKLTASCFIGYV